MKLNYKRTILIGFAFMSILSFWQFYDQVIPYLLEYVFGAGTFAANSIMAIDNVLAIFMLPLFGRISDKTNTKLGKRTPYILFGTICAVILMNILAIMTQYVNFWGFFIVLMLLLFVMSTYRSPAVAYMPDVTPKRLRSKGNAIINLVGYLGGIFSTIVMMFMLKSEKNSAGESVYSADQSFTPVFVVISLFMLISVAIMVIFIKENKVLKETSPLVNDNEGEVLASPSGKIKLPRDVKISLYLILISVFLWYMSYNAVTTAFSRYCVSIWGVDLGASSSYLLTATIVAIASFVPLGFLSSKLGRKKTILIGVTMMAVCYTIACFIKEPSAIMYAIFGIVGIGWAAINVNSFPMVVEMSSSSDIGKYTGYYYAFSMAAQILTPLLSGFMIDKMGLGYEILFPYAVVFTVIAFITMTFVKHGDVKPTERKNILESFDVED